jgi:SAM-dependent methyltransferase
VTEPNQQALWDEWAPYYDEFQSQNDPTPAVDFLTEVAPDGRFLELGVGTGRIALELARRGRGVDGVDISPAMAARLEAQIGKLDITVRVADMVDPHPNEGYGCVIAVFGSLYSLTTQAAQVACIGHAAKALVPGGCLVVENYLPQPSLLSPSKNLTVREVDSGSVNFSASAADIATQRISFLEVFMSAEGNRTLPVEQRFIWTPELDLMAQLAGLSLESRSGGYAGEVFDRRSARHVSVYRKAE